MMRIMRNTRMMAGLLVATFGGGFLVGHGRPATAQAANRVFEIRTYTVEDGKLDALLKRMRGGEARIFDKVEMKGVLFSVAAEPPKSANTFVYILAHESLDRAKESWSKFRDDPEWKQLLATAEPTGPIKVESIFVKPLDFSPLK
jgi:NIPSNAP protein